MTIAQRGAASAEGLKVDAVMVAIIAVEISLPNDIVHLEDIEYPDSIRDYVNWRRLRAMLTGSVCPAISVRPPIPQRSRRHPRCSHCDALNALTCSSHDESRDA